MTKRIMFTVMLGTTILYAQHSHDHDHFKCGTPQKEAVLRALHPEIIQAYEEMRNLMPLKNDDTTIFTIPIVFHVLHLYGTENISDQQIYRQVQILNEDFKALNLDLSSVVPYFVNRIGNARIQFELARFDPFGNCSNGINRYHSFETNQGDDFSKLNPWPRTRYLNVWVVRSMADGVAGYAYYPSSVEGVGFWRDGIIIRHNYIGDIGTGSPALSRALTHEIGHWLGLAHPWGDSNSPGLITNCVTDDGIEDTPNTVGWTTCNLNGTTCDNELDNVQNFMEYSYCSNMFTKGQVQFMRTILQSTISGRNSIWHPSSLAQSIGDLSIPVACNPVADFHAPVKTICLNTPVQFTNHSWRTVGNVSYLWEFPTGTPSTSTALNPTVTWDNPGWKTVRLTVTDSQGSHTKVEEQYIFVSPDYRDYNGPAQLTFDSENPAQYIVVNPTGNEAKWQITDGVGINGSRAIMLRNASPYTDFLPFTNEAFYQNRLSGNIDEFITPSFNLSNTSDVSVSFRYAAATNASTLSEMTERLRVFVSTNCGQSWSLRQTLTGTNLINNGSGYINFVPDQNTIWGQSTFSLTGVQTTGNVRFKFEYTASDFSNNIVIDDIFVSGVLGLEESNPLASIFAYPNPVSSQEKIEVFIPDGIELSSLSILDAAGKEVSRIATSELQGQSVILLNQYAQFNQGVYYLRLSSNNHAHTFKLIVI
jgi:PKD repeat protein